MLPERKPAGAPPAPAPSADRSIPVIESRELLGAAEELLIRHEGRLYRLRRPRLGKLILTA